MKPDANNIGSDRGIQDPQDAIEAEGGVYEDPVAGMPEMERLPYGQMPQAPDPMPFGNVRRIG